MSDNSIPALPDYLRELAGLIPDADLGRELLVQLKVLFEEVASLPPYMEHGSSGPLVGHLHKFLLTFWQDRSDGGQDIRSLCMQQPLGVLGGGLILLLKAYQMLRGLDVDGCCGPETRRHLIADGFDLRIEAVKSIQGKEGPNFFAQPDGIVTQFPVHRFVP